MNNNRREIQRSDDRVNREMNKPAWSLFTRSPHHRIIRQLFLTYSRKPYIVFHMKTTLIIPDAVFRALKERAAGRKETMSALVAEFLVQGLRDTRKPKRPFRFPTFSVGTPKTDVANREALLDLLDRERDERLYGRARKKG